MKLMSSPFVRAAPEKVSRASVVEEVVDVFVGDFGERRVRARLLHLLQERLEHVVELLAGLLHAEPDQTQGRLGVENDDQDDAVSYELDVNVGLFAFMKLGRELLLLEKLRHPARRR